jgi:hypothetical protein
MRPGRNAAEGKGEAAKPSRNEELRQQGWTRMTTIDEPRLSELAETYRELGFQVILEPLEYVAAADCHACLGRDPGRCKTIYTKREANGSALRTSDTSAPILMPSERDE